MATFVESIFDIFGDIYYMCEAVSESLFNKMCLTGFIAPSGGSCYQTQGGFGFKKRRSIKT